jgi:hypothetical protein
MGNSVAGDVSFDVNGTRMTLRFDFNALCELEADLRAESGTASRGRANALRAMVRVALAAHHGPQSDVQAGEIVQIVGMAKMSELIDEAYQVMLGKDAAAGGDPADPQ